MNILRAALLALLLSATGCAQLASSKTDVHVLTRSPDGTTCEARYKSDKEQQGLKAKVCSGEIEADKSGTLESVVAATVQTQAAILRILEMLTAGAKAGAMSGS